MLAAELPSFCAPVTPQPGPLGYQERDGARCEGLYDPSVSAPSIEMLSLTGNAPAAATDPVSIIGPSSGASEYHLVARSMVSDVDYRLDAQIKGAGAQYQYNQQLVKASGLDLSEIALLLLDGKAIVPVVFGSGGAPPAKLRALLSLAVLADAVSWRWDNGCPSMSHEWNQVDGSIFPPAAPIVVADIPAPPQECVLTVLVTADGSPARSRSWTIEPAR